MAPHLIVKLNEEIDRLKKEVNRLKETQAKVLKVKDGDIVVLQGPVSELMRDQVRQMFSSRGLKDIAVIVIRPPITMRIFDEEQMAELGWVKKVEEDREETPCTRTDCNGVMSILRPDVYECTECGCKG